MVEEKTWLGVTPSELADALRKRFGVGEPAIPGLVDKFVDLDPRLRADFASFWETGDARSSSPVEGFTAQQLVRDWRMKGPGAFSALAWLLRDPVQAKEALRRGFSSYHPDPNAPGGL